MWTPQKIRNEEKIEHEIVVSSFFRWFARSVHTHWFVCLFVCLEHLKMTDEMWAQLILCIISLLLRLLLLVINYHFTFNSIIYEFIYSLYGFRKLYDINMPYQIHTDRFILYYVNAQAHICFVLFKSLNSLSHISKIR